MKTSHNLIASIVLLAVGTNLQAADGKTYLKLDAGVALQQDVDIKPSSFAALNLGYLGVNLNEVKLTWDTGFRFDLAAGYSLSESWALELESGLLYNSAKAMEASFTSIATGLSASGSDDIDLNMYQIPILANVVYKFPLKSKFKPFLGAGVGGIFTLISPDGGDSESDFTFAYQGMAGAVYEISEAMELGVTYKFLGSLDHDFGGVETDEIMSHSFLGMFTFKF